MAKQTINIGSNELAGDGESLRSAFQKVNQNFDELYAGGGAGGALGPQGPSGPSGIAGPAGTNGVQGPTGPAGIDGVQGPTGPAGTNGVQGPTGPAGTNGVQGPQGVTGPSGSSVQGPQGVTGPTGPAGSIGPSGPSGPGASTGTMVYKGVFDTSTVYSINDVVSFVNTNSTKNSYVKLNVSPAGHSPIDYPSDWGILGSELKTGSIDVGNLTYWSNSQGEISAVPGVTYNAPFDQLQLGGSDSNTSLSITRQTYSSTDSLIYTSQFHNTADAVNIAFARGRGTFASPSIVQNGDDIADIVFLGRTGLALNVAAGITVAIEGNVNLSNPPAKFSFITNNGSGIDTRVEISSTGTLKTNKLGYLTGTSINVHGNLIPDVDTNYDLGSTSSQWRSLYVSSSTIYIGGKSLSINESNTLLVEGSQVTGSGVAGPTGPTGPAASLGQFKISANNLGTIDNPDTGGWGGYDMYIDPGNGSDAFIYIPGLANQAASTNLQISNNSTAGAIQLFGRGGVQVVTNYGVNEKVFEFADNGVLIIPDAILGSGDQAVVIQNTASGVAYLQLPVDPSADSVFLANQAASSATVTIRVGDFGYERDWTFNEFGALAVPGAIYNNDPSNVGQLLLAGDVGEPATYLALPSDVGSTSMNVRLGNINGNIQLNAGNNGWLFNNGGDFQLPRGGSITENIVTNELWGTTTTSLTLVPAGAANGTQHLEIYSTGGGEGNHIHITSGDQNQTDLFLGNDTQYFAVGAMGQMEVRARPGLASPSPGTSAYAGAPVWIYAGDAGDNGGNTADGASGGDILLQAGISTANAVGGSVYLQSASGPAGFGSIKLSTDNGSTYLEFDKDDNLTFPSGGNIVFNTGTTSTISGVTSVNLKNGSRIADTPGYSIGVGVNAGGTNQGNLAVALGPDAGRISQGAYGVAIGFNSGETSQGTLAVAVGPGAGNMAQGNNAVAIGLNAGRYYQSSSSVAIGLLAAESTQSSYATAIGFGSGQFNQGIYGVAIGCHAASDNQADYGIAIGDGAGRYNQGLHGIAFGFGAGRNNQPANSIIINASGAVLDQTNTGTFSVKPIRNGTDTSILYYNPTTGEITYSSSHLTFSDGSIQTTAFTGTSALLDITNTNGIDTNYYITFVENRDAGQEVRADIDLTFNSWSNTLGASNFTASNTINAGGILFTGRGIHEKFTTSTTATTTTTYDCSTTQLFYHSTTGTISNWTANFTNLNLESSRGTSISIVINQGTTGYYPSAVQIGGVSQTLNWQGNTTPTASANRTDVVTFSILNNSGSYLVLGQITGF